MANMQKYEFQEANCPESFTVVAIRGDMIGSVANCLKNCHPCCKHSSALKALGEDLADVGDVIYRKMDATEIMDIVERVVPHEEDITIEKAG